MNRRNAVGTVDVLVGGQFGSEGKGKVCAFLARSLRYDFAIRSGGPNAAHTFHHDGAKYVTRHLPCSAAFRDCNLFYAAGAVVSPSILIRECNEMGPLFVRDRLTIDQHASIIETDYLNWEFPHGTTKQGVGVAQAEKCLRRARLVRNAPELSGFRQADTIPEIHSLIDSGKCGLLEGVQGFGLSLNGPYYPYCTSRDTHASAIISECGIASSQVRDTYLVIRSYPIRNAGNTGPMGSTELSWEEIDSRAGGLRCAIERGTIDRLPRRTSEFNWQLVERAVMVNRPTKLVLTFADYLHGADYGKTKEGDLSPVVRGFIDKMESRLGVPVAFVSTGPGEEMVERT